MKKHLLGLFLLVNLGINAQDRCTELVQTQLVDKVKHLKSTDLLTYYNKKSHNWGFFDKNSGKKLTKPVLRYANFFKPNLELRFDFMEKSNHPYIEFMGCDGTIMGSKNNYTLQVREGVPRDMMLWGKLPLFAKIKNTIKGFEVDEKGKLTYVSPEYYHIKDVSIFYYIFQFKGKYYAVDNQNRVIDQEGSVIKKFENITEVEPVYSNSEDVWVRNGNKYEGIFTNKEVINNLKEKTKYYYTEHKDLGYRIIGTEEGNGLLDLTTMDWKIKPHKDNIFYILEYTSLEELETTDEIIIPIEMVNENRRKADIYLVREDKTIQDLNGKICNPK